MTKVYAETSCEVKEKVPRVQRGHHPSFIMGVSHQGLTPLNFCKKEVKIGAQVHQEDMLKGVANPLNTTLFSGQELVFQQDSASHKAKTTKEWLRRNIRTFIAEDCPSVNPDLNPLVCKLWPLFKDVACHKHHNNLESLKRSLMKAVAETVGAAIAEWLEHLKTCIEAEGSNFE